MVIPPAVVDGDEGDADFYEATCEEHALTEVVAAVHFAGLVVLA